MRPWLRRFLAITFFTGTAAGAAALLLIAFGAVAWAAGLPLAAFGAAAMAADAFPLPAKAFFLVLQIIRKLGGGFRGQLLDARHVGEVAGELDALDFGTC